MKKPIINKGEKEKNILYWYEVDIDCSNCGFSGEISILKGRTVYEKLCPKCGCYTIKLQ